MEDGPASNVPADIRDEILDAIRRFRDVYARVLQLHLARCEDMEVVLGQLAVAQVPR